MKTKLSIIIPCYNCEKTLTEAVESCYTQGLSDFEIIMVNDGSIDNTKEVLKNISKRYSNIKVFEHATNKGGGAARNTGIKNATSGTFFCLDSDDVLPPNTLSMMLSYMENKKCDGVCIHKAIKFRGNDVNDIVRTDEYGYSNKQIPKEALIETVNSPMCPLYFVFMFNKRSFDITGGYTEDHGFDTQGFAWRFLMNDLVAYTCPNASYLQRIYYNQSYYLREYFSGKANLNWIKILSEFLPAFTDQVINEIINFDHNIDKNIITELHKFNKIFVNGYKFDRNALAKLNTKDKLTFGEYYYLVFDKVKNNNLDKTFFTLDGNSPIPKCITYSTKEGKYTFKKTRKLTAYFRIYRKIVRFINKINR